MSNPGILLTGFADECAIDKTIDQQFSAFAALGLKYLSIRFLDAGNGVKNVMDLTDAEVELVQTKLAQYRLKISSIGSPIGKVKLLDVDDGTSNRLRPFEEYLENEVVRACELAKAFDCKLIRGFSFYHPMGTRPEDHLDEVTRRLKEIARVCDSHGVTFGLEVEANLIGQTGQLLAELHQRVDHPALLTIFDGGNLVTQGFSAAEIYEQWLAMKPGLGWIHIKDYSMPAGMTRVEHVDEESLSHFVPADVGDSGHLQIMKDLQSFLPTLSERVHARGIDGVFVDLEPHVRGGGQFGGFSGPDGFGVALRSFCKVCDQANLRYDLTDFPTIQASK
jgi:sugar phosphate isomerase/epimerase